LTLEELYGYVDNSTGEWYTGVLSRIMYEICNDTAIRDRWMILDGPVDTLWIESMNTVLDSNKILTLLNGDRIALPEPVKIIFEV